MYRAYAADPQMRVNVGIRRRLAPLLQNDRRKIELMNGLLFALPGTPVIYYGDELGMGDNVYLGDRDARAHADAVEPRPQRRLLARQPAAALPADHHRSRVPLRDGQRRGPAAEPELAARRGCAASSPCGPSTTVFGRGDIEFLLPENAKILAFTRRHEDETVLVVANLSRFAQSVNLDLHEHRGMVPGRAVRRQRVRADRRGRLQPDARALRLLLVLAAGPAPRRARSGARARGPAGDQRGRGLAPAVPGPHPGPRRPGAGVARRSSSATGGTPGGTRTHPPRRGARHRARRRRPRPARRVHRPGAGRVRRRRARDLRGAAHRGRRRRGRADRVRPPQRRRGLDRRGPVGRAPAAVRRHRRRRRSSTRPSASSSAAARSTRTAAPSCARPPRPSCAASSATAPISPSPARRSSRATPRPCSATRSCMKIFRRAQEGVNPDLEIGRFLTERGLRAQRAAARRPRVPEGARRAAHPRRAQPATCPTRATPGTTRSTRSGSSTSRRLQMLPDDALEVPDWAVAARRRRPSRCPTRRPTPSGPTSTRPRCSAGAPPSCTRCSPLGDGRGVRARAVHDALPALALPVDAGARCGRRCRSSAGCSRRSTSDGAVDAEYVLDNEAGAARPRSTRCASHRIDASRIRVHGDYHLGQVLHAGRDFVIIDFEGEPSRSPTERRIKRGALTDVAGIVRSFQYAAEAGLRDHAGARPGAARPVRRARDPGPGLADLGHRRASSAATSTRPTGIPFVPDRPGRHRTRCSPPTCSTRRSTRCATTSTTGRTGRPSRCGAWPRCCRASSLSR